MFNPNPPFSILSSDTVDYSAVQFVNRFARYWDLVGNSGRFKNSLPMLLGDHAFERFALFTQKLFETTGQTHKISLLRFYDLVFQIGSESLNLESKSLLDAIAIDHAGSGLKSLPKCLNKALINNKNKPASSRNSAQKHSSRQARH